MHAKAARQERPEGEAQDELSDKNRRKRLLHAKATRQERPEGADAEARRKSSAPIFNLLKLLVNSLLGTQEFSY